MRTCPDCNRTVIDGELHHDDTCPLGLGYDEIQDDDRAWFERYRMFSTRCRPPHWTEVAELRAIGALPPVGFIGGEVVVTRLAPGVRTKSFGKLFCVIEAEDLT